MEFVSDPSKDCLTGDTAILVGTWNWIYTDHEYGWCDGESFTEVLTPLDLNCSFQLIILPNGILAVYKNSSLISEYHLKFGYFKEGDNQCNVLNSYVFSTKLNQRDLTFGGCVNSDTLYVVDFPGFILQAESGCEIYNNYFVKL